MRILLVHLSDIHLKSGRSANPILRRLKALCSAIQSVATNVAGCVVVISGDIAFSGRGEQYQLANKMIEQLRRCLADRFGTGEPPVVTVPGNHDCDFTLDDKVRTILLNNINPLQVDPSVIEKCTSLQTEYFAFSATLEGESQRLEQVPKLYWIEKVMVADTPLLFHLFNSAWLSRLHEIQGKFFLPLDLIVEKIAIEPDPAVSIAVVHHPYNWLESNNARSFRSVLEENVDLILTGHEHESAIYKKISLSGERNEYLEGGVLQADEDPNSSTFNVVLLDAKQMRQKVFQFSIEGGREYRRVGQEVWWPFERNKSRLKHRFELAPSFSDALDDLGLALAHPKKDAVRLSDVFVYPDLMARKKRVVLEDTISIVHGQDTINFVAEHKYILLLGEDSSGKSSLAKALFVALRSNGKIPILLRGSMFHGGDEEERRRLLRDAFEDQYHEGDFELYMQLEVTQRAVLIDDFDDSRLSRHDRNELVHELKEIFGIVLLFGDTSMVLDALTDFASLEVDLWSFHVLEIMQLGFVLRSAVIRRWFALNQPAIQEEEAFFERIIEVEDLVTRFLGRNLLPSFPHFILIVLHDLSIEAGRDEAAGAFGYLYEVLITRSLARSGSNRIDLDTKYNYLTELAFTLFSGGISYLSLEEARQWHAGYCNVYKMSLDFSGMTGALLRSSILTDEDGRLSFKYRYIFYFFVARYFRDHLSMPEVRARLQEMFLSLYDDDNSNVIIFLCHLSKDPIILENMLGVSDGIFSRFRAFDLGGDVDFINRLDFKLIDFGLEDDDILTNRKKHLEDMDQQALELERIFEKTRAIQERDEYRAMSTAIRTTEIIGQILRNFAGSLRGEIKHDLVQRSALVSLRLLSFIFYYMSLLKERWNSAIPLLQLFIPAQENETDGEGELEAAHQMFFELLESTAYAIISGISSSIGIRKVSQLVRELVESEPNISNRLIEIACRLGRAGEFPEKEILSLARDLHRNPFSETLLRRLVWFHFYIYPESFRLRQRVCSQLRISIRDPRLIDSRGKLV